MKQTPTKQNTKKNIGFGLIELLVTISVLTIVMAVVLIRQDSFNSAVLLRSQANEVALEIRTVQLAAAGAVEGSGAGDFNSALGLYFNSSTGANSSYQIFRDSGAPGDNFYQAAEEYGLQGQLDGRFEIREIRLDGTVVGEVAIVFERPDFDARFFTGSGIEELAGTAEIVIAVRGGTGPASIRTVKVSSAGQIAVP